VTLLQVEGASKRFGSLVAIDSVSLTIEPGELRAIIGPNGAGKTTFFNLVSGLFAPTAGSIRFEGRDIAPLAPDERVRRGMSRTFQITEVFPELSVADNIRVAVEVASGYRLRPWLGAEARAAVAERVAELLSLGGLTDKAGMRAGALSHGDQRAAEIMMSLALRPRLLMLDEPSMGIAPILVQRIYETIAEINRDGMTILLVEQNANYALDVAVRGYVLETGRVVLANDSAELRGDPEVQRAYLGA